MQGVDSVKQLEDMLRGQKVTLSPMPQPSEDSELITEDGKYTVSPSRVQNRRENLITLYSTRDGEPIPTDVNRATMLLQKKFPDVSSMRDARPDLIGQYAFTLGRWDEEKQMYVAPVDRQLGKLVCMLHADYPDLEYIRGLGIVSTCKRTFIPNIIELERHMRRHVGAWELIERDRSDRNRNSDQNRLAELFEMVLERRGKTATPEEKAQVLQQAQGTDVPQHAHRYAATVGSQCKINGCMAVRINPIRKRVTAKA